jgi:hypothetical protein
MNFENTSKTPREFLALTGLERGEFSKLLPYFKKMLSQSKRTLEGKERQKQCVNYSNSPLPSHEDKLFFILVYFKQYPTQSFMGTSFGMSQPKANLWIHFLSPVLQNTLSSSQLSPSRNSNELLNEDGSLFSHDGTERPIQRPKKEQRTYYSGKKKTHTVKNNVLANASCEVIF